MHPSINPQAVVNNVEQLKQELLKGNVEACRKHILSNQISADDLANSTNDEEKKSILTAIIKYKNLEITKWLFKNSQFLYFINKNGINAFLFAVMNGHTEAAKWLHGENPEFINSKDKNGMDAFILAVTSGNTEAAEWLLSLNPDFIKSLNNKGKNALVCLQSLKDKTKIPPLTNKLLLWGTETPEIGDLKSNPYQITSVNEWSIISQLSSTIQHFHKSYLLMHAFRNFTFFSIIHEELIEKISSIHFISDFPSVYERLKPKQELLEEYYAHTLVQEHYKASGAKKEGKTWVDKLSSLIFTSKNELAIQSEHTHKASAFIATTVLKVYNEDSWPPLTAEALNIRIGQLTQWLEKAFTEKTDKFGGRVFKELRAELMKVVYKKAMQHSDKPTIVKAINKVIDTIPQKYKEKYQISVEKRVLGEGVSTENGAKRLKNDNTNNSMSLG